MVQLLGLLGSVLMLTGVIGLVSFTREERRWRRRQQRMWRRSL